MFDFGKGIVECSRGFAMKIGYGEIAIDTISYPR